MIHESCGENQESYANTSGDGLLVCTIAVSNITISIIVTVVDDSSTSSALIQEMDTKNGATVAGEDMHLAPTLHFYTGGRGRDQDFLPLEEGGNL